LQVRQAALHDSHFPDVWLANMSVEQVAEQLPVVRKKLEEHLVQAVASPLVQVSQLLVQVAHSLFEELVKKVAGQDDVHWLLARYNPLEQVRHWLAAAPEQCAHEASQASQVFVLELAKKPFEQEPTQEFW
jgi:hypothetical protein